MRQGAGEILSKLLGDPKVAGVLGIAGLVATIAVTAASPLAGAIVAAAILAGLVLLVTLGSYFLRDRYADAYEVLAAHHRWELEDAAGTRARYEKEMRVRFTQNNTIAIWDTCWGQGTIRNESCTPPYRFVDSFPVGTRRYDVISLREKRRRGEEATLTIVRRFENSFLSTDETIEVETTSSVKELSLRIVFPLGRPPHRVTVSKRTDAHAKELGPEWFSEVAGRTVLEWRSRGARNEAYVFRWDWPPVAAGT
jgi:hypothetical protein